MSRKEILDVCKSNFWSYSSLTKFMIIISIVLSAAAVALYICGFVVPTVGGIINGSIVGWAIMWKVFLICLLYYGLQLVNLIAVSIGGSAMCREEGWDTLDFAKAWVEFYEYEKYIEEDENSEK